MLFSHKTVPLQILKPLRMTQRKIKKEVWNILSNMGIAPKALTPNASFIKDLGLDSLDFAELLIELELVFTVEIPIVEAENLQTVQKAVQYINQKVNR